jgi:hypothetical protein
MPLWAVKLISSVVAALVVLYLIIAIVWII